jgi:hypothetical protein
VQWVYRPYCPPGEKILRTALYGGDDIMVVMMVMIMVVIVIMVVMVV